MADLRSMDWGDFNSIICLTQKFFSIIFPTSLILLVLLCLVSTTGAGNPIHLLQVSLRNAHFL